MIMSISLVMLLALAILVLHKYSGLRLWHALLCTAFGFCLATTAAAPAVRDILRAILRAISGQG